MSEETATTLAEIEAPWSRRITLTAIDHESGLRTLRMRIKEGRARFTIIDLDERTAAEMAAHFNNWATTGADKP